MSNKILQALTTERTERLRLALSASEDVFWDNEGKHLLHPGEYGAFREKAVSELLQLFVPEHVGISSGFVITNQGDVSSQCDIILYDRSVTPRIVTDSHQRFFPVESVVGVGEVKSDIGSNSELTKCLTKLSLVKVLREHITNPSPYRSYGNRRFCPQTNPFDHMFTFLICKHLKFNPEHTCPTYGRETAARFRHNVVLSIDDGLYCYKTIDGPPNLHYPFTGNQEHEMKWLPRGSAEPAIHFTFFLSALYNALSVVTLLEPDMVLYLADNVYDVGLPREIPGGPS